ncbi:hypothetical protein FB45DRAFT_948543 [Roridomyces roridus]|uniref:Uncharacterized protein n=1 Tax=Roridomyces roridus TaxID=1738132 RepID=A0AAD7F7M0_9AGAR|nr:hypothetical protein FB45DRAFT_948543 [Roridomyces roridus]
MSSNDPKLPPELEMKVFELSARLHPENIPNLLRIAHRVLTWIEPILYETLIFSSSKPLRKRRYVLERKPPTFWAKSVRTMLISGNFNTSRDKDLVFSILSACIGIESFMALHPVTEHLLPFLGPMRLKRLNVDIGKLFGPQVSSCDLHLDPTFSGLTHLTFTNIDTFTFRLGAVSTTLPLLPELTHLRFEVPRLTTSAVTPFLDTCKRLQVLINTHGMLRFGPPARVLGADTDGFYDDPRFVLLGSRLRGDNDVELRGGPWDSWTRAETFIQKKRRGEIVPASRCWIEESDMIPLVP